MPTAVATDPRVASAIATRGEVANLLHVLPSKLSAWSRPRGSKPPLVHTVRGGGRFTVPLVGIAEAASLEALRSGGMSMHEAWKAADFIRREYDDDYALASPMLFTDGTEAFIDDSQGLMRLRDRQGAIREVIAEHLRPLILGPDGFVEAFRVERFMQADVTIDPRYNAGRMSFTRNRVPVFAVAGALEAGESASAVAIDYDLTEPEVAEVDHLRDWLALVT